MSNVTAAPSANVTSANVTSANVTTASDDDITDAAFGELTACLALVQDADRAYASCVMNTKLFEMVPPENGTKPSKAMRARKAMLQHVLGNDTALGTCKLMCSAPTTVASQSCCQAADRLYACQPTQAIDQVTQCKAKFDTTFVFQRECSGVSSGDIGLMVTTGLLLAGLCVIAGSARHFVRKTQQRTKMAPESEQQALEARLTAASASRWSSLIQAWRQITNLVWKNLLIRQRKPIALVIEQFLPVLLSSGLVLLANLESLFGSSNPSKSRTLEATTNTTTIFCMNYTVTDVADLGGPNSTMSSFYSSGQAVLGMFFLVSYIKFVSSTTTTMVIEKENRIREIMKIMGLSDFTLLCSWYLTSAILSTPLAFTIAAELKFGNVFPTTELGALVLLFWSLSMAIVAFSYFMTPFFQKSRTAAIMSVLFWLILYFPFYAVQPALSNSVKYWAALSPPTAFGLAIDDVLRHAQLGTGFAYSLGSQQGTIDVPSSTSMSLMLLFDAVLLACAGWYLEQVLPQKYGLRKPWNFLFVRPQSPDMNLPRHLAPARRPSNAIARAIKAMLRVRSLKAGFRLASSVLVGGNSAAEAREDGVEKAPVRETQKLHEDECSDSFVEPVSSSLALQETRGECLSIRGLRKTFQTDDGEKVAVAGLDLTLYSGQITALLGHNGAGKTTVISMLTGLLPPTAGDATMFGRSTRRDFDALRRIIGICPQHDVLFNELTVEEHLQLFGTMKHVAPDQLSAEVNKMIDLVGLTEVRGALSQSLSGGQKRKLSVALAFIGDSKLVFLDEPTSGMDPYSRRFTWNLLQKSRADRVIVLTTHFMDEADILGDRIAIVADGQLRCAGSSLFLKTRFGTGYNLTVIRSPTMPCDPDAVATFLQKYVPGATCLSNYGSELVFQLPIVADASSEALPEMLQALDQQLPTLGLQQYGISVTTLEEVFLRIARDRDDATAASTTTMESTTTLPTVARESATMAATAPPARWPAASFCRQLAALIRKRAQIGRRDRKTMINSVGIPVLFLAILVTLPRIQVADFIPDYGKILPTTEQQQMCPAETITDSLLKPKSLASCVGPKYFQYCELGLVKCDVNRCCNAADFTSPWYQCNNCKSWPTGLPVGKAAPSQYRCFNNECLKKTDAKLQVTLNAFLIAFIAMLAFAFIPASIVAFVVREKDPAQNAKSLQLISGTSVGAYWLSNWMHDAVVTSVPVALAVALIPLSYEPLRGGSESLAVTLIVVSHVLAYIPLAYLLSRHFTRHAVAQTTLLVFGVGVSGLLSIFSFLCRVIDFRFSPALTLAALDRNYLRWLFLAAPGYALNSGLYEIATRKLSRKSVYATGSSTNVTSSNPPSFFGFFEGLSSRDPNCIDCWDNNTVGCCTRDVFDVDVAGAPLAYSFGEALLFTVVLFYLERRAVVWNRSKWGNRQRPKPVGKEDDDVAAERQRVTEAAPTSSDLVAIRNLHHQYSDRRAKVALKDLCLSIPAGECFGYLGINGAGKSTTMQVLTGLLAPTSGVVTLAGHDVAFDMAKARRELGYCPQFDALHDLLTVEEQLELYARLKGVPEREVHAMVREQMALVGLMEYRDKRTRSLSGGNKRKVSTAIALLGSPRLIFLDEPSTGVDASSRRKMWNVIAAVVARRDACVLLTTHSMEECEALCTRVGILVSGALQCLGSVEHLKQKFGRGYTVEIKLREPPRDVVERTKAQLAVLVLARRPRASSVDITTGDAPSLQLTAEDITALAAVDITAAVASSDDGGRVEKTDRLLGCEVEVAAARVAKISSGNGTGWLLTSILRAFGVVPIATFAAWWAAEDQRDELQAFVQRTFEGTVLVEQQGDLFRFQVPKEVASSSGELPSKRRKPHEVFRALEQAKARLNVSEYGVSDTSLEHIFNNFASQQEEERGEAHGLTAQ